MGAPVRLMKVNLLCEIMKMTGWQAVSCCFNRLVKGYRVYIHHPTMHCTSCPLSNVGINHTNA